jgi:hypothetical protein
VCAWAGCAQATDIFKEPGGAKQGASSSLDLLCCACGAPCSFPLTAGLATTGCHTRNRANPRMSLPPHQENQKALVGLATRPNQSQARANKTRPDQQDDQSARGPLCLEPEVAQNVFFVINLCLNHQFFSDQNNKTKPEHQSLPLLLMLLCPTRLLEYVCCLHTPRPCAHTLVFATTKSQDLEQCRDYMSMRNNVPRALRAPGAFIPPRPCQQPDQVRPPVNSLTSLTSLITHEEANQDFLRPIRQSLGNPL